MSFSTRDLLVLPSGNLAVASVLVIGATIAAIILLRCQAILGLLVSRVAHIILLRCYPIQHVKHEANLPSLPYHFPNGQGNVEKFLRGRINSAEWELQYGGLYRLWSGMSGEVVLTKPAHVEAVFRDSHNHSKAQANDSGYLMDRLLGSCLGLISGRPWRAVKHAVEAPFLHSSMSQYVADVQDFAGAYLRRVLAQKDASDGASGQQGKRVVLLHPVRDIKLLPFLFVAKIVYGPLDEGLERELTEMIQPREDLFKPVIGGGITRFAWSRFLPLPAIRAVRDFKDGWARWNDRAHAHGLRVNNPGASAAPIVAMYRAVEEGRITREQLLQTLDEILFANIDVTMCGLSWALVFLAAHRDVQEALRSEVRRNSPPGPDQATPRDAYLLSSWVTTPTLLGACILEAARLRPPAAFSVPQACPTERVLEGFRIPAGTNFVVDAYALNVRDPFWGHDRDRYRPERWLERQKSEGGHLGLRYRYWRFGFGPRTCLGKHLAELIMRAVVVEMVEHWYMALEGAGGEDEDGMDWPWDDETWIHSPELLVRCEPLAQKPT